MSRQLRNCLLCALMVALGAGTAFAAGRGEQLFDLEAGDLPAFRGAEAAWRVRADTELLARGPGRLYLETPDGLEFEARRMSFERRGPGSLTWRGRLTDSRESRAIFSMEDGALSGWMLTPFGEYEVRPLADGGSAVLRMSNEPLGGCDAIHPPVDAAARADATDQGGGSSRSPAVAADGPSSIDLMALFSARARDQSGSVATIKSRVRLMVDMANDAFANSKMNARLNLVYLGLSPFREVGTMSENLDPFRFHPQVRALRETHSADLVALIQGSDAESCGIAYLMDEISPTFSPYAYSVTAYSCATTLRHEVGHNMGMEHDPANASPPDQALFPWAFGHFVRHDWRTVMSYPDPCGECFRLSHFSNPDVFYENQATGIAGERDNARVGDRTAGTVANFRLSGVVLTDGFESGAPTGWNKDRGGLRVVQPGLEGNYRLEIPMTGLSSRRYLAHTVGPPGRELNVEFLLNANGVELGDAEVDILVLFGNGTPHTKLVLKQEGSVRRVSLVTRGQQGGYVEVASTNVRPTRTERIGIEWRSAADPTVANGLIRLAKNGGYRGTLKDFANHRWVLREVRLGIPNGAAGTSGQGSVYVDNYRASVPLEP